MSAMPLLMPLDHAVEARASERLTRSSSHHKRGSPDEDPSRASATLPGFARAATNKDTDRGPSSAGQSFSDSIVVHRVVHAEGATARTAGPSAGERGNQRGRDMIHDSNMQYVPEACHAALRHVLLMALLAKYACPSQEAVMQPLADKMSSLVTNACTNEDTGAVYQQDVAPLLSLLQGTAQDPGEHRYDTNVRRLVAAACAASDAPTRTTDAEEREALLSKAELLFFPIFRLLNAQPCTLHPKTGAIAGMRASTSAFLYDREKGANVSPGAAHHHVQFLLMADDLFARLPDFPAEIFTTTDPSGCVEPRGAPPDQRPFQFHWSHAPVEVRQSTPAVRLWCLITLRRFVVLMLRWGMGPLEVLETLVAPHEATNADVGTAPARDAHAESHEQTTPPPTLAENARAAQAHRSAPSSPATSAPVLHQQPQKQLHPYDVLVSPTATPLTRLDEMVKHLERVPPPPPNGKVFSSIARTETPGHSLHPYATGSPGSPVTPWSSSSPSGPSPPPPPPSSSSGLARCVGKPQPGSPPMGTSQRRRPFLSNASSTTNGLTAVSAPALLGSDGSGASSSIERSFRRTYSGSYGATMASSVPRTGGGPASVAVAALMLSRNSSPQRPATGTDNAHHASASTRRSGSGVPAAAASSSFLSVVPRHGSPGRPRASPLLPATRSRSSGIPRGVTTPVPPSHCPVPSRLAGGDGKVSVRARAASSAYVQGSRLAGAASGIDVAPTTTLSLGFLASVQDHPYYLTEEERTAARQRQHRRGRRKRSSTRATRPLTPPLSVEAMMPKSDGFFAQWRLSQEQYARGQEAAAAVPVGGPASSPSLEHANSSGCCTTGTTTVEEQTPLRSLTDHPQPLAPRPPTEDIRSGHRRTLTAETELGEDLLSPGSPHARSGSGVVVDAPDAGAPRHGAGGGGNSAYAAYVPVPPASFAIHYNMPPSVLGAPRRASAEANATTPSLPSATARPQSAASHAPVTAHPLPTYTAPVAMTAPPPPHRQSTWAPDEVPAPTSGSFHSVSPMVSDGGSSAYGAWPRAPQPVAPPSRPSSRLHPQPPSALKQNPGGSTAGEDAGSPPPHPFLGSGSLNSGAVHGHVPGQPGSSSAGPELPAAPAGPPLAPCATHAQFNPQASTLAEATQSASVPLSCSPDRAVVGSATLGSGSSSQAVSHSSVPTTTTTTTTTITTTNSCKNGVLSRSGSYHLRRSRAGSHPPQAESASAERPAPASILSSSTTLWDHTSRTLSDPTPAIKTASGVRAALPVATPLLNIAASTVQALCRGYQARRVVAMLHQASLRSGSGSTHHVVTPSATAFASAVSMGAAPPPLSSFTPLDSRASAHRPRGTSAIPTTTTGAAGEEGVTSPFFGNSGSSRRGQGKAVAIRVSTSAGGAASYSEDVTSPMTGTTTFHLGDENKASVVRSRSRADSSFGGERSQEGTSLSDGSLLPRASQDAGVASTYRGGGASLSYKEQTSPYPAGNQSQTACFPGDAAFPDANEADSQQARRAGGTQPRDGPVKAPYPPASAHVPAAAQGMPPAADSSAPLLAGLMQPRRFERPSPPKITDLNSESSLSGEREPPRVQRAAHTSGAASVPFQAQSSMVSSNNVFASASHATSIHESVPPGSGMTAPFTSPHVASDSGNSVGQFPSGPRHTPRASPMTDHTHSHVEADNPLLSSGDQEQGSVAPPGGDDAARPPALTHEDGVAVGQTSPSHGTQALPYEKSSERGSAASAGAPPTSPSPPPGQEDTGSVDGYAAAEGRVENPEAAVAFAALLLLRVWRGYVCRSELAKRWCEKKEEDSLDAQLRFMMACVRPAKPTSGTAGTVGASAPSTPSSASTPSAAAPPHSVSSAQEVLRQPPFTLHTQHPNPKAGPAIPVSPSVSSQRDAEDEDARGSGGHGSDSVSRSNEYGAPADASAGSRYDNDDVEDDPFYDEPPPLNPTVPDIAALMRANPSSSSGFLPPPVNVTTNSTAMFPASPQDLPHAHVRSGDGGAEEEDDDGFGPLVPQDSGGSQSSGGVGAAHSSTPQHGSQSSTPSRSAASTPSADRVSAAAAAAAGAGGGSSSSTQSSPNYPRPIHSPTGLAAGPPLPPGLSAADRHATSFSLTSPQNPHSPPNGSSHGAIADGSKWSPAADFFMADRRQSGREGGAARLPSPKQRVSFLSHDGSTTSPRAASALLAARPPSPANSRSLTPRRPLGSGGPSKQGTGFRRGGTASLEGTDNGSHAGFTEPADHDGGFPKGNGKITGKMARQHSALNADMLRRRLAAGCDGSEDGVEDSPVPTPAAAPGGSSSPPLRAQPSPSQFARSPVDRSLPSLPEDPHLNQRPHTPNATIGSGVGNIFTPSNAVHQCSPVSNSLRSSPSLQPSLGAQATKGGGGGSPPRSSAAAGAYMTPMEGESMFPSTRSMSAYSSMPFSFSATARSNALDQTASRSDFYLSRRRGSDGWSGADAAMGDDVVYDGTERRNSHGGDSVNPEPWVLNGVDILESDDPGDETAEDENNSENNSGNSSDDEDADHEGGDDSDVDERAAFDDDMRRAADGVDKNFFAARENLLRDTGDGKPRFTATDAAAMVQRIGRAYLCRRHLRFLFLVKISWPEVNLIHRVAKGYVARKRLGYLHEATRLARESMDYWELRNRSAITMQRVVRGFVARQRVRHLQRKLKARLELRIAVEQPDDGDY